VFTVIACMIPQSALEHFSSIQVCQWCCHKAVLKSIDILFANTVFLVYFLLHAIYKPCLTIDTSVELLPI